jgi:WD40 repeat protein
MFRIVAVTLFVACSVTFAAAPAPVARDRQGDALPRGALARMGTPRLRPGEGGQRQLRLSPDKKCLAFVDYPAISLWDTATGKRIASIAVETAPTACFTADSKKLLVVASERKMITYDCLTGRRLKEQTLGKKQDVYESSYSVLCSADGKWVGLVLSTGFYETISLEIYELPEGNLVSKNRLGGKEQLLAFAPDGKTIASCDSDVPRLRDAKTGKIRHVLRGGDLANGIVAFSPDSKALLTCDRTPAWSLWNVETGKRGMKGEDEEVVIRAASFAPDGKSFLLINATIARAFDARTGRQLRSRKLAGVSKYEPIRLSDDCHLLAYHEGPSALQVMDLSSGQKLPLVESHGGEVMSLTFSPDGKSLATLGQDTLVRIRLWETRTGKPLPRMCEPLHRWESPVGEVRFSPDGKHVLTPLETGLDRLDVTTGKRTTILFQDWHRWFALSEDKKLIAASLDLRLVVLDASNGKRLSRIDPREDGEKEGTVGVRSLSFSPNGRQLLAFVISRNVPDEGEKERPSLLVVDWKAGKVQRRFGPPRQYPYRASFGAAWCPDGRYVALADQQALLLLDADSGEPVWKRDGSKHPISQLCFSPDGRWIATAGRDSTIHLREIHSGEVAWTFSGHHGKVSSLAFSPDGRCFASGGADSTAVVWDLFANPFGQIEKLSPAGAEKAWGDLSSRDAAVAFRSMRLLAGDPAHAAKSLGPRLRKIRSPVTAKRLAQLIADLDDEESDKRDQASDELARIVKDAEPVLRQACAARPSLEVTRRLEKLLRTLRPSVESLRARRAVAVLEYAGTSDAVALLRELARDSAHPVLRMEAKAAVARRSR